MSAIARPGFEKQNNMGLENFDCNRCNLYRVLQAFRDVGIYVVYIALYGIMVYVIHNVL